MSTAEEQDLVALDGFTPRRIETLSTIPSRVQYACGLNVLDGWLNVDYFDDALIWNFTHLGGVPRRVAESAFRVNLLERHPFDDESFDFAFCEDFIEHIQQQDAILFLSEVRRTLKLGGVLRLATPSLPGVMQNHFRNAGLEQVTENQEAAYSRWGHVHFFSHESLQIMTSALGFRDYRVCDFRESRHPELQNLETRVEQASYQINMYAEITR